MKRAALPSLRRYAVHESSKRGNFPGRRLGHVESVTSLHEAAIMAAVMLNRADARPVAALISEERGVFIAFGKVPWIRYSKRERVDEVRFSLILEKDT